MIEHDRMGRSQLCADCYWFMSAINVIMEGESFSSERSFISDNNNRMIYKANLKKYLRLLPNSYDFFNEIKFKHIILNWLTIYDRRTTLQ